jgi:hypothetical protein
MSRRTNKQNRMMGGPDMGMGNPQPTTVNVDLSAADDVVCDNCGNYTFVPVMMMKRLSAILSPTGQEAVIPIQSFACNACGWINAEFLPTQESRKETQNEQSASTIIV